MRCPDCEKMVSYGDPEIEVTQQDIDDEGNITIEARMVLPCGDCGTELKEYNFILEGQIDHECPKNAKGEEEGFEIPDDVNAEYAEDYKPKYTTDKKGNKKPVPMRYQKHYYGIQIDGVAKCQKCGEEIDFSFSDETTASSFDELV